MRAALRGMVLGLVLAAGSAARACDRAAFAIAIDPGHTRASPGAISARGVPEAEFNEVLAQRVMTKLEKEGFATAFLTHHNQASISLLDRALRAGERNAQLFVSIHHDSAQPQLLSTWTYRGRQRPYSEDIAGYSLFVSDSNGDAAGSLRFAQLLGSHLRGSCLTPTLHHAEKIPGESRELLDEKLGIYRFDDLVVLKSARMPAVLFEAGVIVNRDEELLLRSATHQKKLASALAGAVVDFCEGRAPQPVQLSGCR
jgi:N-acetylmuramoyl-L-alanine amidase